MKKNQWIIFIYFIFLFPASLWAESGVVNYFKTMGKDYVRGVKNVISSPAEIPITMKEYRGKEGYPVFLQMAGFADGTFQMIARCGSGLWDFGAGLIPGAQDGYPPDPETLF